VGGEEWRDIWVEYRSVVGVGVGRVALGGGSDAGVRGGGKENVGGAGGGPGRRGRQQRSGWKGKM